MGQIRVGLTETSSSRKGFKVWKQPKRTRFVSILSPKRDLISLRTKPHTDCSSLCVIIELWVYSNGWPGVLMPWYQSIEPGCDYLAGHLTESKRIRCDNRGWWEAGGEKTISKEGSILKPDEEAARRCYRTDIDCSSTLKKVFFK